MRIAIASVQVPFVRGGAELLAENLLRTLRDAGHEAEIVTVPFQWHPAERLLDNMLLWRSLDLGESNGTPIDRVIALKFPAYLLPHDHKILWLLHQHRDAYDLWEHEFCALSHDRLGMHVRQIIRETDRRLIPEARARYTLSRNVSDRLRNHCGLSSEPLYHPPPDADRLRPGVWGDYLLMPSRVNQIKRQALILDALALTRTDVRVVFMGAADNAAYGATLRARSAAMADRVRWTGHVSDQERRALYAEARAVLFPPEDEDYGYVTLEAMLSAKAVVTCTDSGGPLEFVAEGETGLICPPEPAALAHAMDRLWADRALARRMGEAGLARYRALNISWDNVVSCLLA